MIQKRDKTLDLVKSFYKIMRVMFNIIIVQWLVGTLIYCVLQNFGEDIEF